jgi:peptidoglycan/xylan/chitin deacetylase (PgdA/CDA1 family)
MKTGSGCPSIVLAYHSVDDDGSVLSTSTGAFDQQMQILQASSVRVMPLEELWRDRHQSNGEKARVAITFDDGFHSVYEHAFPVLARHGFPATVFLVSDHCGKLNDWPGQPPFIRSRPLMSWDQAREMSRRGMSIQCHTRTHPDLTMLSPAAAEEELAGSKQRIEDALGMPVSVLAYPYGACNDAVKRIASRHFDLACTTRLAFVDPRGDALAISRVEMYYLRSPVLFRRLLSRSMRAYLAVRRMMREVRARVSGPEWGASAPVQVPAARS